MELKVKSIYEPLDISVETSQGTEAVIHAKVNVGVGNLKRLASVCIEAANKIGAVQALAKKGARGDIDSAVAANAKVAGILEGALTVAIGPDSYGELIAAVAGEDGDPSDCTMVTAPVFQAVREIVEARTAEQSEAMNEKAAHYLPEEEHAQTEPHPAAD